MGLLTQIIQEEGTEGQNVDGTDKSEGEREDNTIRNLALGTGVIAIVLAGNVLQFKKTRHTPGKDAAKAYNMLHDSKLFRGGRYNVKPPWLVRKYGAENVTDEMINRDIEENFHARRKLMERIDLERWKSLRMQRVEQKERTASSQELHKRAEQFRKSKLDAMFRNGLITEEEGYVNAPMFSAEILTQLASEMNRPSILRFHIAVINLTNCSTHRKLWRGSAGR